MPGFLNDCVCLGIDVGGTNLRCAVVDEDGAVLLRDSVSTNIASGRNAFLERLFVLMIRQQKKAEAQGRRVLAAGLGVPGLLSNDGVLRSSVNLLPLEGMNLAREVSAGTGLPTVALNDANASAVGEQQFGAGRPFSSCLMLTLGTGVGAGLILEGRLWTGIDGVAGEFGHITVEREGRPCGCGNRGCLEQYSSASAIASLASQAGLKAETGTLDAAGVAALARRGEARALAVFQEAGACLGIAVADVVNLLNLEAVIVGGGVAESFDLLSPALLRELRQRSFPIPRERVRVLKGELRDDAGVLGAAATALALLAPLAGEKAMAAGG